MSNQDQDNHIIMLETQDGHKLHIPEQFGKHDDEIIQKGKKKDEFEYKGSPLKFFKMIRNHDIHNTSGTGHIIDGIVFSDGTVVVHWRTEHSSIVVYKNYDDFEQIHINGHDANRTEVHWYYPDMDDKELEAETLAKRFHKIYEAKAGEFDYETKDETSVPWSELPDNNKQLMLAVCRKIIDEFGLTDRGRS